MRTYRQVKNVCHCVFIVLFCSPRKHTTEHLSYHYSTDLLRIFRAKPFCVKMLYFRICYCVLYVKSVMSLGYA